MKNAEAVLHQDRMSSCTLSYTILLSPMQIPLMKMMMKRRIKIRVFDQTSVHLLSPVYCVNCWI